MLEKEPTDEAPKSALESDYAALYAVAGLTDALADALKGALAETQQKASKRLNELQTKRPELSKQAKAGAEVLRTFVITLPGAVQAPAGRHQGSDRRAAEAQANDLLVQATSTYADFAERGKHAVDDVRQSARDRSSKATKPVTPRSTDVSAERVARLQVCHLRVARLQVCHLRAAQLQVCRLEWPSFRYVI